MSQCLYFNRRGMEAKSAVWEVLQSTHVFADWDAISEQSGVNRTCAVCCVVDVVCVDSDEGRA